MFKLLVVLYIIKLYTQINIHELINISYEKLSKSLIIIGNNWVIARLLTHLIPIISFYTPSKHLVENFWFSYIFWKRLVAWNVFDPF